MPKLLTPVPARLRFGVDLPDPKFRSPRAGKRSVRRGDLLARLEQERDCPLILLRAPAGYGKTTLLTQWAQEERAPVRLGDDGRRRCRSRHPGGLDRARAHRESDQARPPRRLRAHPGRRSRRRAHGAERRRARRSRAGSPRDRQLAVSSRCEPALGAGPDACPRRGQRDGHARICRCRRSRRPRRLDRQGSIQVLTPVQTLVHRAEGWPAALALATAWARRAQLSERVDPLCGDDHLFSEYFCAELLASLPPEMLRFLSRELGAGPPIGTAVRRGARAQALGSDARRSWRGGNVPLRALDPGHESLSPARPVPGDAPDSPAAVRAGARTRLHRRAAAWYRRAGDVDRALDHTAALGTWTAPETLLWENLRGFLGDGRNHMVQQWLSGVGVERVQRMRPVSRWRRRTAIWRRDASPMAEQWARSAGGAAGRGARATSRGRAGQACSSSTRGRHARVR